MTGRTEAAGSSGALYCAEQVARFDRDRYLVAILAPRDRRADLLALYAFNLEIAKTREIVTEPLIGRMRLQWWRDTIDSLYGGRTVVHEVAQPLAETIRTRDLPRAEFERLIDAREADLDDAQPPDLSALERYAAETNAPVIRLSFAVLGSGDEIALDGVAEELGAAWGLVGLLRALPFHANRHRLFLPADLLESAGLSPHAVFERKAGAALPAIVQAIGEAAAARLDRVGRQALSVPARQRLPLLFGDLARLYLSDLRRAGWDPFIVPPARPLLVLRLLLAKWSRSI